MGPLKVHSLCIICLKNPNSFFNYRDMVEYKGRVESYSREMLRKESQIKDLQTRMETGDGCKYLLSSSLLLLVHLTDLTTIFL